ncbi:MAG TPA: flagellar motor protein MotB [Acidimicrobiales bacterium]|nr:flagellar motor protein MotB [Acidimicrobiales bacterium]
MSTTARRHHRGGHAEEHENSERWLLTYADMITLLLALFVVLFAMSSINVKKFLEFKLGLTQTFNPTAVNLPGGNGLLSAPTIAGPSGSSTSPNQGTSSAAASNQRQLRAIADQVEQLLAARHLQKDANVNLGTSSVVVQILADRVFFQTDSASLGSVGAAIVDTIAQVVRPKPNVIEVQGYTDNQPITGGPFASNWELSAARAANVTNRLNVVDGIPATRLSASGYSDTHPAAPNTSPANQARNRRIDVVILGVKQP